MILAAERKGRIAALDIAEQEELFKDILVLTDTEELDTIMILVDLIYLAGVVDPEQRRSLFRRLAEWTIENGIIESDSFLDTLVEQMEPQRFKDRDFTFLLMITPYLYEIILGDYGIPKEELGPNDPVMNLSINEDDGANYSINNLPQLKKFIEWNEHLDSLARDSYLDFIQEVEKRYK